MWDLPYELSLLDELYEECRKPDWDSHGAAPVGNVAIDKAKYFVSALYSQRLDYPEFGAEPDGCVTLEWRRGYHQWLSVSVGPAPRLDFAWMDGSDRGGGSVIFDEQTVPRMLVGLIKDFSTGGF